MSRSIRPFEHETDAARAPVLAARTPTAAGCTSGRGIRLAGSGTESRGPPLLWIIPLGGILSSQPTGGRMNMTRDDLPGHHGHAGHAATDVHAGHDVHAGARHARRPRYAHRTRHARGPRRPRRPCRPVPPPVLDHARHRDPDDRVQPDVRLDPRLPAARQPRDPMDLPRARHRHVLLGRQAVPHGRLVGAEGAHARHDAPHRARDHGRLLLVPRREPRHPRPPARLLVGTRPPHRDHAPRPLDRDALDHAGLLGARGARGAAARRGRAGGVQRFDRRRRSQHPSPKPSPRPTSSSATS